MDFLRRALKNDPAVTLDVAALDLASLEFPGLEHAPSLDRLDELAAEVSRAMGPDADGLRFLQTLAHTLGKAHGFQGNADDYYSPRNSCLNAVLESGFGIPITLSLIYIEVARRLGRTVLGIGLPGHFVVEHRDGGLSFYLDPFHQGRFITAGDCRHMALDNVRVDIAADASALEPVSRAYLLTRMLNNLRASYFRAGEFRKGADVLDILIESAPLMPEYYKARAVARMQLRRFGAASLDFQRYLQYSPEAEDRPQIAKQMELLHRYLGSLN